VPITLREVERRNAPTRYVLSAADYQRLLDLAVKD
jgi:PHD/YefM family antitoxin component YafN of YafNO toxin-antitoxin module